MAKESMKAREVKRAKLVAKYAEKKKQLKAEGNYEALQLLPKTLRVYVCTTVVKSPVVPKDISVNSGYPYTVPRNGFGWTYPGVKKQAGNYF